MLVDSARTQGERPRRWVAAATTRSARAAANVAVVIHSLDRVVADWASLILHWPLYLDRQLAYVGAHGTC